MAESPQKRIAPGDILQGKFRVERIIGRGGMGLVIEATNLQLDEKVALKLLLSGADDPSVVERFSREARAAARLRSEHVARVYDVGKDTLYGPFIVMEMLEGKTLAELITTARHVRLHRAVEYVIDACDGLAEAHARGIVHQDVKPANLFLVVGSDGHPSIKLLDFGIATMRAKPGAPSTPAGDPPDRSSDPHSDPSSSASSSKKGGKSDGGADSKSKLAAGTPAYLAPEQLRQSPSVDHRADIWALGCVLFELLTGERAFKADRFTELVLKILESPRTVIPPNIEIPIEVVRAIDRCLEKDAAKRYTSTAELALALLPFAKRRAHASVARAVAQVKAAGLDPHLQMPSSMPPRPSTDSSGSVDIVSSAQLRPPNMPRFSDGFVMQHTHAVVVPTSPTSSMPAQVNAIGPTMPVGARTQPSGVAPTPAFLPAPPPPPLSSPSSVDSARGPEVRPHTKVGVALLALLAVVLAVFGVVGMHFLDQHRAKAAASRASPSATTTVAARASPSFASTSEPSSSSEPLSSSSTASEEEPSGTAATASSVASSNPPPKPRPALRPAASTTTTATPANSESEIRHSR